MNNIEKVKEKLEVLAKKKVASDNDDFNTFDYSGGNYDDAYSLGCDSGEVWLARELLKMLK